MKYAFILFWLVSTAHHFSQHIPAEAAIRSAIVGAFTLTTYWLARALIALFHRIVRR